MTHDEKPQLETTAPVASRDAGCVDHENRHAARGVDGEDRHAAESVDEGGSRGLAGVALVPLVGPKEAFKEFVNDLFLGVFDLVTDLFGDILREFIYLDPAYLEAVESVYQVGMVVFFGLLLVYGAATFGLFEVFPNTKQTDPIRFSARALVATTSLWIVNPPGWSSELTGQGAFAAAFVVVNELSALYLDELGGGLSFQSQQVMDSLGGPFILLAFGYLFGGTMLLAELVLLALLVMRQVLVVVVYGAYPLLIAFWIADGGPMKYGKQLAEKLFKTATVLTVGGILLSAVFAVGMALITDTSTLFAGGTGSAAAASSSRAPVSDGVFASGGAEDVLLEFVVKAIVVIVVLVVPSLLLVQMLGAVGGAVSSVAQAGVAVATSGASLAGSVAAQGARTAAKEVGKKGLRKGVKSTAKKGAKKAKDGAKKKAGNMAKNLEEKVGPNPTGGGGGRGDAVRAGSSGGVVPTQGRREASTGAGRNTGGSLRERTPDLEDVPAADPEEEEPEEADPDEDPDEDPEQRVADESNRRRSTRRN